VGDWAAGRRTDERDAVIEPEQDAKKLEEILAKDPRYAAAAYEFTRHAVTYASHVLFAHGKHVSGRDLLESIRRVAIDRYGLLAEDVLASWGLRSTEDFGEIVFHLVDAGLLSKTDEDTREDFRGVYDFRDAFGPDAAWKEIADSLRPAPGRRPAKAPREGETG
jgi:uncharacterized repeat protein (TIGR04138 family)